MEPSGCPDPWLTRKPKFNSAFGSQLDLFLASGSGATTQASSPIRAPVAGFSSASPLLADQTSSATEPSPSPRTWSGSASPSSPLSRSKQPPAGPRPNSAASSITSAQPAASQPSSDHQLKRCELQQKPSEVSEELRRFFRKLADLIPEPTDDEMIAAGLSPARHSHEHRL